MRVWQIIEMTLMAFWEFMSFVRLCMSLLLYIFMCNFCSMWVDELCETLRVSLTLVLFLCQLCWAFISFLRSQFFLWNFQFAHERFWALSFFSWEIICFVSVVSRFCSYLWELRVPIFRDLVLAFSLGFWISWMSLFSFFLF